jgi:1,4-alpha-glucan branching enzyme
LVSVAGSFNDWNRWSLPCVRKNGEWVCRINLEPGTYQYKFVIDGVWTIDPSNTKVVEDNGNLNSVLVVEK